MCVTILPYYIYLPHKRRKLVTHLEHATRDLACVCVFMHAIFSKGWNMPYIWIHATCMIILFPAQRRCFAWVSILCSATFHRFIKIHATMHGHKAAPARMMIIVIYITWRALSRSFSKAFKCSLLWPFKLVLCLLSSCAFIAVCVRVHAMPCIHAQKTTNVASFVSPGL